MGATETFNFRQERKTKKAIYVYNSVCLGGCESERSKDRVIASAIE